MNIRTFLLVACLLAGHATAQVSSNAHRLQGKPICTPVAPLAGQTLVWNGTCFAIAGPGYVAKADATAQSANIGVTSFYTVPAGAGGLYRASCYLVITQAASTSSTLPSCTIRYLDNETGVQEANAMSATGYSGNTVGLNTLYNQYSDSVVVSIQAGSTVAYQTSSYASSGATPMQYSAHVRLEYLGK